MRNLWALRKFVYRVRSEVISAQSKACIRACRSQFALSLSSGISAIRMRIKSLIVQKYSGAWRARQLVLPASQAGVMTDDSRSPACILDIRPVRVIEELDRGRIGFGGLSRSILLPCATGVINVCLIAFLI